MRPPCADHPALFDSTVRAEHMKARAICATCPIIGECRQRLRSAIRDARYGQHPSGTWAGVLVGDVILETSQRIRAAEESLFTDEEAKAARNAHERGDEGSWATVGYRVYMRRRKRLQMARREVGA